MLEGNKLAKNDKCFTLYRLCTLVSIGFLIFLANHKSFEFERVHMPKYRSRVIGELSSNERSVYRSSPLQVAGLVHRSEDYRATDATGAITKGIWGRSRKKHVGGSQRVVHQATDTPIDPFPPDQTTWIYDATNQQLVYIMINETATVSSLPRVDFLPNYKNPCWYEEMVTPTVYDDTAFTRIRTSILFNAMTKKWTELFETQARPRRLRCLPYFFIAGQPKCGTTDLYEKLMSHPEIVSPPMKESHWWAKKRFGWHLPDENPVHVQFRDYVDLFDKAALLIERNGHPSTPDASQRDHTLVTGDGSASTLWFNDYWENLPGNSGYSEPRFVNAHSIQQLLPNSKIIVILRDPTERLYSDYLYFHPKRTSVNTFHTDVRRAVALYDRCMDGHSPRACLYNRTVAISARVRLRIGMYCVYLEEWLRIFPKSQIHVVRLEDYAQNPSDMLKQVFGFLELKALSAEEEKVLFRDPHIANTRRYKAQKMGDMRHDTREILNAFYLPYNQRLAVLMHDAKYLWTSGQ